MGFHKLYFVWMMMMMINLFFNDSDQCDVYTDATVDAIAGEDITLTCKVKNQTSDRIHWRTPEGFIITEKCESVADKFKIYCSNADNLHAFQLKFKGQWTDRGKYICHCDDTKKFVELNMQVRVRNVTADCLIKNTNKNCSLERLSKYDTLLFTATSGCATPVPTISWYIPGLYDPLTDSHEDSGKKPIDTSAFGGTLDEMKCTGQDEGLTKVVSTFSARWGQIEMADELKITTSNGIGRGKNHVFIQGNHDSPHNNLILIYVIIAIAIFVIIFLILLFVRWRCKCIRTGDQFGYRPVLRSKWQASILSPSLDIGNGC
ncbi:uncharacterized protein LOC135502417 [Lineus longissimus]|uniref:uncharacterized protein LOC135502417 n=1 Tax=Lineus longissimus TaxID=88925 RepID=UPI002B4D702D